MLQVYLKLLYTVFAQFRAVIADLKTPEKTDSYLLTWLRGKEIICVTYRTSGALPCDSETDV